MSHDGDGTWARRLGDAVDAGDEAAARRSAAAVPAGRAARDAGLELLARRAAGGSLLAADLLATVVDDVGLARAGVRRVLVDESEVDDVTQDTLVSMTASLGSFTGEASFVTWLFTIARRRAIDHLRRRRATEPLAPDEVGEAARISSLVATRTAVRAMVARLPDSYRRAVELRDIERLPYGEVARRLGQNVNTVKSHVARGRALLARMLAGAGG
ncbi:MAG TPA: RNA polymerase sigma factor [Acidimicrobiales bacterium]|nr:RNA polymerase sigma factor [Acidimicrobiales bacterium]